MRLHPVLYDAADENYSNQDIKNNVWESIQKKMNHRMVKFWPFALTSYDAFFITSFWNDVRLFSVSAWRLCRLFR